MSLLVPDCKTIATRSQQRVAEPSMNTSIITDSFSELQIVQQHHASKQVEKLSGPEKKPRLCSLPDGKFSRKPFRFRSRNVG